MLEYLSQSFLHNLGKDAFKLLFRGDRRLTSEQKIEMHQKWRPIFENEIQKNWKEKLRSDIVLRDVRRVDSYPEVDERSRGISSWFRVGLIDTYHRGILVAFNWDRLIPIPDGGWREKEFKVDTEEGEKVIIAGKIPFENIEAVDLNGDEYYYYPRVFCHFSIRRSPYESIAYYTEFQNPGGRPHYTELIQVKKVKQRRRKRPWYWLWG